MTAASKANKNAEPKPKRANSSSKKTHSSRARKIMTPVKQGTIKRSVIRKVIREVIAKQPVSNES